MKNLIIISFLLLVGLNGFGQDTIIDIKSPMAEFSGGTKSLYEFIAQNMKIPSTCKKGETICNIFFTVTKDGDLLNLRVDKCEHELIQKEIIRVFSIMPKWIPAKYKGENIECPFAMPLNIKY